MSFHRTSQRILAVSAAALVAVAGILPVVPAQAATGARPPFKVSFPQETQVTQFSNDWAARRSGGRRHGGNDLMAPKMAQVYAFADGVVETVATSRRGGRYIVIEHGDGWSSTYIHLNNDNPGTDDGDAPWSLTVAPTIEEGAVVKAGQLIGWVGDSGNAEWTGSHTHFELAVDGRGINPHYLLEEAWARDQDLYIRQVLLALHDEKLMSTV